jgi:RNA polymerase sigma factor (TIGR02999 family)
LETEDPAITRLLHSWRMGDAAAHDDLVPLVYDRLRKLASHHLRGERPGHTLGATALVHEAYLKLAGAQIDWQDRSHFFAVASTAMRRVLVDHAKHRGRQRRGGEMRQTVFDEALVVGPEPDPALIEIDEALDRLEKFDPRKAKIVEMTYFGGMSYAEVGEALGVSEVTVKRDLRLARAWLLSEMKVRPDDGTGREEAP